MNAKQNSAGFFEQTIWSTVLKAKAGEEQTRAAALERLLTRYRQPILRHIQACQGCSPEQAEDLTQGFLHQCLRLDFLSHVSAEHGRFRTFIKTCIKNFLRDQHVRERAAKRGGGQAPVSLDETDGEGNRVLDPATRAATPDVVLDREWALNVLNCALETLRHECMAALDGPKQPQEAGSSPSEHAMAFGGRAAPSVLLTERIGDRIPDKSGLTSQARRGSVLVVSFQRTAYALEDC
jgi:hypothetical protein